MGGSCDRGEASAFPALSQSRNVAAAAPGFVVLYPGCASPPNHPQSLTTPKKTNPQIATVHFISSVSWLSAATLFWKLSWQGREHSATVLVCQKTSRQENSLEQKEALWVPFLVCLQWAVTVNKSLSLFRPGISLSMTRRVQVLWLSKAS